MRPDGSPHLDGPARPLAPHLLLAAGLGAAALLAPEALRAALEALPLQGIAVAPLVTSLGRDEALEHDLRRRIYHRVREDPGICASALAEAFDIAWGTVIYHLRALEETGHVVSVKHGRHRRFFENGGVGGDKEALATLRRETTAEVYETIREEPGLAQKEVAERVGLSPSALAWHIDELEEAGLLERERDGRRVHHYAADGVRTPVATV